MNMVSNKTRRSIRLHLLTATLTIAILGVSVGGWAATTSLAGAVIAPGVLEAQTSIQSVQHPKGGVVREILVREGDQVEAGEVLFRLDRTQPETSLQIILKRLDEALARRARQEAEQVGIDDIEIPPELHPRMGLTSAQNAFHGEQAAFEIRRRARDGQKAQLGERIEQLRNSVEGYNEQIQARDRQIELAQAANETIVALVRKKLVAQNRLTTSESDLAGLKGERGQLISSVAEAEGKIADLKLQMLQIDREMQQAVSQELAQTRSEIAELMERRRAAEEDLADSAIHAPLAGSVHELALHTVGGVARPGETLVRIVPRDNLLVVAVRIPPKDINDVVVGQETVLRFSGANAQTTPEIQGTITLVSPNVSQDERTGQSYYTAKIALAAEEREKLVELRLMPGMPVEAFIKTGMRTVLSYLLQPVSDQMARAFRE